MEFIGIRNIEDLQSYKTIHLGEITIHIPSCYYNPIAYLKKNCVLWLQISEKGDCEIFRITNEKSWKKEILEYVKHRE